MTSQGEKAGGTSFNNLLAIELGWVKSAKFDRIDQVQILNITFFPELCPFKEAIPNCLNFNLATSGSTQISTLRKLISVALILWIETELGH